MNTNINFRIFISIVITIMLINGCSKTEDPSDTKNAETVTDIDGNVYKTVKIGTQTWMAENLKTTRYRDGSEIHTSNWNLVDGIYIKSKDWNTLTTGGCYIYGGDKKYCIYNWYAVNNTKNIAPLGWHVASDAEWSTLITYLGGDIASFSIVSYPGHCTGDGLFYDGDFCWWSSTEKDTNFAYSVYLTQSSYTDTHISTAIATRTNSGKSSGQSVRCVKNL